MKTQCVVDERAGEIAAGAEGSVAGAGVDEHPHIDVVHCLPSSLQEPCIVCTDKGLRREGSSMVMVAHPESTSYLTVIFRTLGLGGRLYYRPGPCYGSPS